jgi:hypothetical protein
VAAALQHVQTLDGRELAADRTAADRTAAATPIGSEGASALQHLAAMQLQAFSQVRCDRILPHESAETSAMSLLTESQSPSVAVVLRPHIMRQHESQC